MTGDIERINGLILTILFREKVAGRPVKGEPVLCEYIEGDWRKDGKAVRAVLAMRDVDPHLSTADILITEIAHLTDPQTGRIHENKHGLLLEVSERRNESTDLIPCGDKGEISIKLP